MHDDGGSRNGVGLTFKAIAHRINVFFFDNILPLHK